MKSQENEKLQNRILEYEVLKQKIIILRDHSTCTDCIHNRFIHELDDDLKEKLCDFVKSTANEQISRLEKKMEEL